MHREIRVDFTSWWEIESIISVRRQVAFSSPNQTRAQTAADAHAMYYGTSREIGRYAEGTPSDDQYPATEDERPSGQRPSRVCRDAELIFRPPYRALLRSWDHLQLNFRPHLRFPSQIIRPVLGIYRPVNWTRYKSARGGARGFGTVVGIVTVALTIG